RGAHDLLRGVRDPAERHRDARPRAASGVGPDGCGSGILRDEEPNVIAQLEEHRDEIADLCRRFGVRRLEVFGSASTGAFRPGESDFDFRVEFESPEAPGYAARYFGLKQELEDLLGASVDLVVERVITNRFFRASVDESRHPLYAA